jgi:exonuclease VII large subunit
LQDATMAVDALGDRTADHLFHRIEMLGRNRDAQQMQLLRNIRSAVERRQSPKDTLAYRLNLTSRSDIQQKARAKDGVSTTLHALNPTEVLRRGYALVSDQATGQLLTRAPAATLGSSVDIQFIDGTVGAKIEGVSS